MTENVIFILKMCGATLPFIFLCFFNNKMNLPKPDRSKQFLMPVLAVLSVLFAMIEADRINDWLMQLIENIPKWITALGELEWMPDALSNFFINAGNSVAQFFDSLNLNFWIFFISNVVIFLVYLTLKGIFVRILSKAIKQDSPFHAAVSGNFYEFFAERNKWCLKENCFYLRQFFRLFYWTAAAIASVLVIVCAKFYDSGLMTAMFYPVYVILIVGELYFYLDGLTKKEFAGNVLGEDEEAYRTVNYSLLRKFLRSIFGDKLLSENTGINNALLSTTTTDEIIRELEKSEDQKIVTFAAYIASLNRSGFRIDHNYLYSALDLLDGKSILFNNPFYNDLIPYAFYPMNRVLLNRKKALIILGRHAVEDDILKWVEEGVEQVTNLPFMWRTGILDSSEQELDIGIITRSAVLDIGLHNANREFLENVGFCIILEPSKLLSTAQIGLNLIAKKCMDENGNTPVYCLCDKNCDGLVDAMSHVLMTALTEVSATGKHTGTVSDMCWEADSEYLHHRIVPNISRYLGIGTELSFAALKNQVAKTIWYGGDAFPVTDMRWIDKQYYYDLMGYASLPTTQDAMDEFFETTPNFWSAKIEKNSYMTVEDESFNMFETLRDFSTRTTEQGFVNVISSQYLLKDYMAANASIFETDAKAIPFIVSDYVRSNRNTVLRLILMMSTYPVSGRILEKELSLIGIKTVNLEKQLWYEIYNCYSSTENILELPDSYWSGVEAAFLRTIPVGDKELSHEIIRKKEEYDSKNGKIEERYFINDPDFLSGYVAQLRSAGYVCEDERGEKHYLGSELSGHIYQKYLPGQFFTFGGKYYEMQYITAGGNVLVRRAADHITGRPSYRQIREYTIHSVKPDERIGACRLIGGMRLTREFADISVKTPGYYRMSSYNDFATAKKVLFEGEKSGIPERVYHNKEILCIEFPEKSNAFSDNVRCTVTVLLNEVFRTVFAENQAYICAVTDSSCLDSSDDTGPFTYSLCSDGAQLKKNAVYIIEDSQLDLGLTVAFERNLQRIFGIIYDYIEWHTDELEFSLDPPPEPEPNVEFGEFEPEETGLKGLISRIKERLSKLFGKRKKKGKDGSTDEPENDDSETDSTDEPETDSTDEPENEEPETDSTDEPESDEPETDSTDEPESDEPETDSTDEPENEEPETDSTDEPENEEPETDSTDEPENNEPETDSTDDPKNDVSDSTDSEPQGDISEESPDKNGDEKVLEDKPDRHLCPPPESDDEEPADLEESLRSGYSIERLPYHKRYYTLYGRKCEYPFMDISGTYAYLSALELENDSLRQAREGRRIAEIVEATFKPGKPDSRYCDFCGTEIYGVEYETLSDGRDRCIHCSRTAIKTEEEFRRIFEEVRRNMESFFGIRINAGVRVEMVNSKTLHKRLGKAFIPTPGFDGRVLGVAISDKYGYTLLVENGSPRMMSMLTMAHELTHIWQYLNWNDKHIRKKYGRKLRLEIYEGMAKWAEIQYAYLINEPATAKREEILTMMRNDEYGHGFIRYRANYPFSTGTVVTKRTPFMNTETPLEMQYCGKINVIPPSIGVNPGDVENAGAACERRPRKRKKPVVPDPQETAKGIIERDVSNAGKYAYSLLTEDERVLYDAVLEAIRNFVPEISPLPVASKSDSMGKVVEYVRRDHAEIFWFTYGARWYSDASDNVSRITFEYCMTPEERDRRQTEIEKAVEPFLSKINDSMSDYEVVLKLYENMIALVDYDTIGLEEQKKIDLTPTIPDDLRSVYGVFVNKKSVCAGYAKAFQLLLNLCGIGSVYVCSATHAWNIVKLEGDWYHFDVTWGDGSNTKKEDSNPNRLSYDYFCMTTEEVLRLPSHIPENDFPIPECTATGCNYYRRNGLFFETFDYERIRAVVCKYAEIGKTVISLKFTTQDLLITAERELVSGGKFIEAIQYANLENRQRADMSYSYSRCEELNSLTFYIKMIS